MTIGNYSKYIDSILFQNLSINFWCMSCWIPKLLSRLMLYNYNKEGCIKLKIDFYTTSLYCLSVLRTILLLQNLRLGRCCQGLG